MRTLTIACLLGFACLFSPSAGIAQSSPETRKIGRSWALEAVTFTRLEEPAQYIHVLALGYGFTKRWAIKDVSVGLTKLLALAVFPDGKGFSGLLPPETHEGMLSVWIEPTAEVWTGTYFTHRKVSGVARRSLEERETCAYPVVPGHSIGNVHLGMTLAQLRALGAKHLPGNKYWLEIGPVKAMVQDGKVKIIAIERATACLVEGAARRKVDLETELPYADCKSKGAMIGSASATCGTRGLEWTDGNGYGFPELRVTAASGTTQ